jgi:hypothetical protein
LPLRSGHTFRTPESLLTTRLFAQAEYSEVQPDESCDMELLDGTPKEASEASRSWSRHHGDSRMLTTSYRANRSFRKVVVRLVWQRAKQEGARRIGEVALEHS